MTRLLLIACVLFPLTALADEERENEEAALEADMDAARARIRELKHKKRDDARAWAQRWREQQATTWPAPSNDAPTIKIEPCAPCQDARPKRSTFLAEPKIGWSLLNHRHAGTLGLNIGGLVKERVEISLSLNVLYARGAGLEGADAGLAYAGVDANVLIVNSRFVRVGAGAMLGGGAYVYGRDGGLEFGSVFTAVPHANVEFRPLTWLAVGIDAGYRVAVGHRAASMDFRALSGPVASAYLRFGL